MPVKERRKLVDLGTIGAAGSSSVGDGATFTSGLVYITSVVGGDITLDASYDGTNWAVLDTLTVAGGVVTEVFSVPILPSFFRLTSASAAIASSSLVDCVRDIG